jgi:hypothetical protein
LRQQVKELNELVTAKTENMSENSSLASASEKLNIGHESASQNEPVNKI